MPDLVWYASYGSNLMRARFLTYIQGGLAPGAARPQIGCTDSTLPRAERRILLHHDLYFSRASSQWEDGGVAFVQGGVSEEARTLGRMYLVAASQFEEIFLQENGLREYADGIRIDYDGILQDGPRVAVDGWYGKIIPLGEEGGFPILTFTAPEDPEPNSLNPPGPKYLTTIVKGLQESYPLSPDAVLEYLAPTPGIQGLMTGEFLETIVRDAAT